MSYQHIVVPTDGEKITCLNDPRCVPDQPIIAFVEGDGIGRDIMNASRRIWDAAVEKAYSGRRKIAWMEIYAGEKAANGLRRQLYARRDIRGAARIHKSGSKAH